MDLVEDHELLPVVGQVELRLREPGAIRLRLEVEVDGITTRCDVERQSGLSALARTEETDGWELVQCPTKLGRKAAGYHHCNCVVIQLYLQ